MLNASVILARLLTFVIVSKHYVCHNDKFFYSNNNNFDVVTAAFSILLMIILKCHFEKVQSL